MENYTVRAASISDMEELSRIENICFPIDEAADYDSILYRMTQAGQYFFILETIIEPKSIVGFVNGTCTSFDCIHHESMSTHDATGRTLVIHSGMV